MFDSLSWRRQTYERYLLDPDDEEEELDDWDDPEERYYREEIDDGESVLEHLARVAADIEAGRAEVPPRWQLDRPIPGILVWTTPAGRRYASDLTGEPLPLPAP